VQPRAEPAGQLDRLADGLVRGLRAVGSDDDRGEHAAVLSQASLTIAMTIPASTKITMSACVQIQNGDTARA
jgi:hypothetical protein